MSKFRDAQYDAALEIATSSYERMLREQQECEEETGHCFTNIEGDWLCEYCHKAR